MKRRDLRKSADIEKTDIRQSDARPEAFAASGLTKRTQNNSMLSYIPTYKDEPSAHGRCELEARRSVHPERM